MLKGERCQEQQRFVKHFPPDIAVSGAEEVVVSQGAGVPSQSLVLETLGVAAAQLLGLAPRDFSLHDVGEQQSIKVAELVAMCPVQDRLCCFLDLCLYREAVPHSFVLPRCTPACPLAPG